MKIFLDNNAYDKLLTLDINRFNVIYQKCTFYACDTINDELEAMRGKYPDKLQQIKKIVNKINILKAGYFGFCSYDNPSPKNVTGFRTYNKPKPSGCVLTYKYREYYNNILAFLDKKGAKKPKGKTNINDAHIATLSYMNDCTLITYDGVSPLGPKTKNKNSGLYQAVEYYGGTVMTFDELLACLRKS